MTRSDKPTERKLKVINQNSIKQAWRGRVKIDGESILFFFK